MKDNKNTKAKLSDPVVEEQELDDDVNAASKGIEPGSNKDRRSGFPLRFFISIRETRVYVDALRSIQQW